MSSDPQNRIHEQWMARCIALARRGYGHVSPNPLVGSVIVDEQGDVLGEGWHQAYGGPHAERNAVWAAEKEHDSEKLKNATLYVNLEPCSHYGKTPPCSRLILEKGIPRVVVGMVDPYEKVSGRGIEMLRDAGVEVCVGVLNAECQRLNEAFSHHLETGRPLVNLKIAQTLDGYIATSQGDSQWVSGEQSRTLVHTWRSQLDAVLIGAGTALTDNPSLTVRHTSGRHPYRVVLDRTGQLPTSLNLFTDDFVDKTIAVVRKGVEPAYAESLIDAGGSCLQVNEPDGHLDLVEILDLLGQADENRRAFQSILVEAGPGLATTFIQQDLVDHFNLFIAPKLIGSGKPTLYDLSIKKMTNAHTFAEAQWQQVGEDMLFQGYRRKF